MIDIINDIMDPNCKRIKCSKPSCSLSIEMHEAGADVHNATWITQRVVGARSGQGHVDVDPPNLPPVWAWASASRRRARLARNINNEAGYVNLAFQWCLASRNREIICIRELKKLTTLWALLAGRAHLSQWRIKDPLQVLTVVFVLAVFIAGKYPKRRAE